MTLPPNTSTGGLKVSAQLAVVSWTGWRPVRAAWMLELGVPPPAEPPDEDDALVTDDFVPRRVDRHDGSTHTLPEFIATYGG